MRLSACLPSAAIIPSFSLSFSLLRIKARARDDMVIDAGLVVGRACSMGTFEIGGR